MIVHNIMGSIKFKVFRHKHTHSITKIIKNSAVCKSARLLLYRSIYSAIRIDEPRALHNFIYTTQRGFHQHLNKSILFGCSSPRPFCEPHAHTPTFYIRQRGNPRAPDCTRSPIRYQLPALSICEPPARYPESRPRRPNRIPNHLQSVELQPHRGTYSPPAPVQRSLPWLFSSKEARG